jgi:LA2681-like HEPN
MSARAKFLDSLLYARWGVRTGLAAQAFAAATNLLDKIAGLVHLYFGTGRVRDVYFRTLWHPRTAKRAADVMDPKLADQFRSPRVNRGLMALCDLSCDLEQPTALNELLDRRHTATHRFLAAHTMLVEGDTADSDWLERVEWRDLIDDVLHQLSTARAALVYLARMIDIAEGAAARKDAARDKAEGWTPTLPIFPAVTEHPDYD